MAAFISERCWEIRKYILKLVNQPKQNFNYSYNRGWLDYSVHTLWKKFIEIQQLTPRLPWLFKIYLYFHGTITYQISIRLDYFCWYFIIQRAVCISDFKNDLHPRKSYDHVHSVRRGKAHKENSIRCLTLSDCNASGINITQRESYWSIWPKCRQIYFLDTLKEGTSVGFAHISALLSLSCRYSPFGM